MWWIIGIAIAIAMFFLFVRFTVVEEGTGKVIMRFGGVVKVFIQWVGYRLDEEGDAVSTEEKIPKRRWYGGLRVWIGLPIDKSHTFKLRYHTVEEVQGKRMPVFHEEVKNCVLLRPDRYWRKSLRIETKDGQFPDVEWLIGMRSINPEKTIFKSPHNWVENALTELEPLLRRYIYTKTLKEVLDLTREQIWKDTGDDRVIQVVLKDEWGIQIDDQEIGVYDVAPPPGYQEALAAKSKAEMEAEAVQKRAEIEAKARAAETVGTVIEMMAASRKKTSEQIRKEIEKNPRRKREFLDLAKDLIIRKLGIDGKAYVDIRVQGAKGGLEGIIGELERGLLELIAARERMPPGGGPKEKKEEDKSKRKKFPEKEEVEETLRETYGKK